MCAAPNLPLLLPTTSQRKVKWGPLKDPARPGEYGASKTQPALMVSGTVWREKTADNIFDIWWFHLQSNYPRSHSFLSTGNHPKLDLTGYSQVQLVSLRHWTIAIFKSGHFCNKKHCGRHEPRCKAASFSSLPSTLLPSYPPFLPFQVKQSKIYKQTYSSLNYIFHRNTLPRKLRGREDPRCPNCCPSLAKRPKMSVPELPPVEAPEEEVEEEVKITAEEMANMAVSNRPHTQVIKWNLFLTAPNQLNLFQTRWITYTI